jgi:hypothetical protein
MATQEAEKVNESKKIQLGTGANALLQVVTGAASLGSMVAAVAVVSNPVLSLAFIAAAAAAPFAAVKFFESPTERAYQARMKEQAAAEIAQPAAVSGAASGPSTEPDNSPQHGLASMIQSTVTLDTPKQEQVNEQALKAEKTAEPVALTASAKLDASYESDSPAMGR